MLANYFIMALRHLRRDKISTLINILGLSLSIAACLLIFQYALFELRYDRYHRNADQLYRITATTYENDRMIYESALSSRSIAPALKERCHEIFQSARLLRTSNWFDCALKYTNEKDVKIFNERHLYYADPAFLGMFTYKVIEGDGATALNSPFSIVLSRSAAERYFGDESAIGKVLLLIGSSERNNYTVTGVIEDPSSNSHIDADIFLSMSSIEGNQNFKNFDVFTYLQMDSKFNRNDFINKLQLYAKGLLLPNSNERTELSIHPVTDIHLYQNVQDEMKPTGSLRTIYFLLLVAGIILLIAWINYINLTTARSLSRSKEVGVRKVSGATRPQLVYQFLAESVTVNTVSIVAGVILVYLFGSQFYRIVGLTSSYSEILHQHAGTIVFFLVAILFTGIFSTGLYPSAILSSYNPALVLKGKFLSSQRGLTFQKSLVVFQFACSIGLTTAVLVFGQQFRHMQTMDLGIDIGKTIVFKAPSSIDSTYQAKLATLKTGLLNIPIVRSVTSSSGLPGENNSWTSPVTRQNDRSEGREFIINIIDPDFIDSYKLKLLAGRNFQMNDFPILNHFGAKIEPVILNKLAIEELGFSRPEEAINTAVYWNKKECRVVGVVDNFHQRSLKNAMQPVLLTANTGPHLSLKLDPSINEGNMAGAISTIHKIWNSIFPDSTFDYFFLDDFISNQYVNEEQVTNLFQFFCWLAVIISSIGLFGLSSFTVSQRKKEVSIRKILGATPLILTELLTKEFLLLVIIASCVVLPFSYLGLEQWLESFAFHIDLNVFYFIAPVIIIVLVSGFTIGFQTYKTINSNPAEILKHE